MKCDKRGARVKERFQCGDLWLCQACYPKDRIKQMYPLWKVREKQKGGSGEPVLRSV